MNRKAVLIAVAVTLIVIALSASYLAWFHQENDGIVCQVWSKNGPDGESFEFKAIDFNSYGSLEEGPLSGLDALRVVMPNGTAHYLEKDFQAPSSYSGEGGRRWVLYGPPGYGFPPSGDYLFEFLRGGEVVRSERVDYLFYATGYPSSVTVELDGRNVSASWTPPADLSRAVSYKLILSSTSDWSIVASLAFHEPSMTSGTLPEVPMNEGGTYMLSVALYHEGGFAYSEDVYFTYGGAPPKPLPPD